MVSDVWNIYCAPGKFPANGTGSALLHIEKGVEECDATKLNSSTKAGLPKNIVHFYTVKSIKKIKKSGKKI